MAASEPLVIHKVDHEDAACRKALLDYLAPHEAHSLFIVGNLTNRFPGSHLYVAVRGGQWVGVAGYYAGPRSLVPFATDPDVARALVRHVAQRHRPIEYLNGIAYAAQPAYVELFALGWRPANDPRQVFLERELAAGAELPRVPHEECVRALRPDDVPGVARLLRCIQRPGDDSPVTETEIRRAAMNPFRLVVEADGQVAATGATNGLGLRAFQILAVATAPAHRRQGFARAVCAALMRSMQRRGARNAVIFTDVGNHAAQACYAKLGFRATGDFYVARFHVDAVSS